MSKVGESSSTMPNLKTNEMSSEVNEIFTKRLKELETLLEEKYKLIAKRNVTTEEHVCGICSRTPSIPIILRGYPPNSTKKRPKSDSKERACPWSQQKPVCLECGRAHIIKATKEKRNFVKCPGGCCFITVNDGVPIRKKYGDLDRRDDDPPHLAMYIAMDAHGIGNTVCRRCDKDCGSILELVKHNRTDCTFTKVKCDLCQLMIPRKYVEAHKENCFRFCAHCGIDGPKLTFRKNDRGVYEVKSGRIHLCQSKVLSVNKNGICSHPRCSLRLTTLSIMKGEHDWCTTITKGETRTVASERLS